MRYIILLSLVLITSFTFSQNRKYEQPNYKKIAKEIKNKKSNFYYSKLLQKFHSAKSELTLEEKRYLYYGSKFQNTFFKETPYSFINSLKNIMEKPEKTTEDLEKIVQISDSALVYNPFNLQILNNKMFACDRLKKENEMHKTLFQFQAITGAIMSSGDGLSENTAFHVVRNSDEYDILGILDFDFGGEVKKIKHYDYLILADNPYRIKGLYFLTPFE